MKVIGRIAGAVLTAVWGAGMGNDTDRPVEDHNQYANRAIESLHNTRWPFGSAYDGHAPAERARAAVLADATDGRTTSAVLHDAGAAVLALARLAPARDDVDDLARLCVEIRARAAWFTAFDD